MTYIGDDGSVLVENEEGFRLTFPSYVPKGLYFKDICKYSGFTIGELLWIHNLHASFADALDLRNVAIAEEPDADRLAAVYKLHADRDIYRTLSINNKRLINMTIIGHECSYVLVSQAQKYLKQLELDIKERETVIHSSVYDMNGCNFIYE